MVAKAMAPVLCRTGAEYLRVVGRRRSNDLHSTEDWRDRRRLRVARRVVLDSGRRLERILYVVERVSRNRDCVGASSARGACSDADPVRVGMAAGGGARREQSAVKSTDTHRVHTNTPVGILSSARRTQ